MSTVVATLRLSAEDFADVSTERLEADITTLASQLAAGECRLLLMIAELDRRGSWATWGAKSCAHWLNYQCGLDLGAARERVRVAHSICELDRIRDEFSQGRLSYSKVRALTRVATAATEDDLVDIALLVSASQLERIVRAYRNAMPGDVDTERVVYEQRNVSWRHGENGEVIVQARLTAEGGAAVIAAIEAATQTGEDVSAETTFGQRRADALVAVAEAATAAMAAGDVATVVSNVVVIADVGVLSDDDPDGCCHIADGPALAPETARRLACDCAVDLVVQDGDGGVLDVGRRTRSVPAALRRAVLVRDGCCVWPGCADRVRDIHHLRHWTQGGATKLDNLAGTCSYHHHLVHEGRHWISRSGDGTLTFHRPDGRPIRIQENETESATDAIEHANTTTGIEVDPDGCAAREPVARIDLEYTVNVLCDRHERHWN